MGGLSGLCHRQSAFEVNLCLQPEVKLAISRPRNSMKGDGESQMGNAGLLDLRPPDGRRPARDKVRGADIWKGELGCAAIPWAFFILAFGGRFCS